MIRTRTSLLIVALGFGFASLVGACGDETINGTNQDIGAGFPDTGLGDAVADDTGTPTPDPGPITAAVRRLEFVMAVGDDNVSCDGTNRCSIFLSYNEERSLQVKYTGDGKGLVGQQVFFSVEDDPNQLAKLSSFSAITDAEGISTVGVQPLVQQLGSFSIKADVGDAEVPAIYFDIVITPKGIVPLTVVGKYAGSNSVTNYTVRLFAQGNGQPSCADLDYLYNDATASQQGPQTSITQTVKFAQFPNLEADVTQTYTVFAFSTNPQNAVVAWGCNDVDGVVQWGAAKTVTINLNDRPPLYAGSYELHSRFDFVSALPESVQPWVRAVLDIFQSPVGGILKLTCQLGGTALADFCGVVFNDPVNPSLDNLSFTGDIVVNIINTIVEYVAADSVWGDILAGGSDVSEMIQNFQIDGVITFKEEPDAAGMWTAAQTTESWTTVYIKWSVGANCDPFSEPGCGTQKFSLNAIDQQDAVGGSFTASVANTWDLTIDDHPLNLKYGALLNYIIKTWMLPLLTGTADPGVPKIDDYETFIQTLLAGKDCIDPQWIADNPGITCCKKFANDVAAQGGQIAIGAVETACDTLSSLAPTFLEDQLVGLDTDTGDAFVIGTAEPCKFYDAEKDWVVDGFGKVEKPCMWKVKLDVFGVTTEIDSDFYATKLD